jgi:hypothetical protein
MKHAKTLFKTWIEWKPETKRIRLKIISQTSVNIFNAIEGTTSIYTCLGI